MNTNALKIFAQQTRKKLRELVQTKLKLVLTTDSAELRGREKDIETLKNKIAHSGEDAVVEEVAYTWFNRVMAFRFMDANGYTNPRIVTPAEGQQRPEILQDALSGSVLEELFISVDEVNDLLSGRTGVADPQAALYRRLLVAECNRWGEVMPFLFERIADYTELLLPDDLLSERSFVTDIRQGMSDDDCQQEQLIGWLYQFYIIDRKEDAEQNKTKKGGLKSDEQAAATQLFTPHWIVRYMVENTLGRIWLAMHPQSNLKALMPYYIAPLENEKVPIPEEINGVEDIRFIDPCMGSGHVLVYAFELFCHIYEEEGYQPSQIPNLIFEKNLFGIDIDPRCYQLASFALSMKARSFYSRFFRRAVAPNVIALHNVDSGTIAEAGKWPEKSTMWSFTNVDTIGSLLKVTPEEYESIHIPSTIWDAPLKELKLQAKFLSEKYHCVVTNPPYLGKGMGDVVKEYALKHYSNSKSDLFAAFIERCIGLLSKNGITGLVTMESWMFLSSYENLRKYIIDNTQILSLSHFDWYIMRIAFGTVSFILQNRKPSNDKGVYSYLSRNEVDLDKELPYVFPVRDNGRYNVINQNEFEKIPGSPIGYWVSEKMSIAFSLDSLDKYSKPSKGMMPGASFLRYYWEVDYKNIIFNVLSHRDSLISLQKWYPYFKGGSFRRWFGNMEYIVDYQYDGVRVKNGDRNPSLYFKDNINWSKISSGLFSARKGELGALYDDAACQCRVFEESNYNYILGLLNSITAQNFLWCISQTFNYISSEISKIPTIINCDYVQYITNIVANNISISRQDWDAHETSWDFKTFPLIEIAFGEVGTDDSQSSGLCINNNLCLLKDIYRNYVNIWRERFFQLHANEEELNRQFIEIYGLQDELTPDVPLEEITILQQGEIKFVDGDIEFQVDVVMKQFISYLVGCFMGRYSVDKPGLIIADTNVDLHSLGLKVQGLEDTPQDSTLEIDDDGIIPILDDEYFNDDMTVRIQGAIEKLFGRESYAENIRFMEEALGKELRKYMDKDFYKEHVQRYKKRPIYWMFSSAKGTFKALVYMHRLQSDSLSKMHADYVLPFISMLEQKRAHLDELQVREDISSAEMNRARKESEQLRSKLMEVRDFEQRLVAMASRRITIDLDDGVRINYPKFGDLLVKIPGLEKE
ncbi:BREX-1 system adenine-specific DNA-methyltransferase PglX [Macellibacteroides fermentans]|uniref:site-specific DNA-methyltransferase (adenine-specific) n=1 Tax=Parabacteroides chartae TaxID=1037355 RepID=A0A1T5DQ22_9BACT|nr:BREX-1 system adenine-specific DNA-methyltransferase PglX [Parabacteroides chartae]SKB73867.1 Methyltransferase domain-containing protein [Parabacteroides chartae]